MSDFDARIAAMESSLKWQNCEVCGDVKPRALEDGSAPSMEDCQSCLRKYGPVLVKCSLDIWPVVVRLNSGVLFLASSCDLKGEWITFINDQGFNALDYGAPRPTTTIDWALKGRGLCVALSDIAWCVDTDS